jgi:hypothetical protein
LERLLLLKYYVNDGRVVAEQLCSLLKHLKPALVEKLCWEQNLDYLTDAEIAQLEQAAAKNREELQKESYGINPTTFYQ